MQPRVFVLGTDHRFQRRDKEFADSQHERFEAFILQVVDANKIAVLAEENNAEALAEAGVAESTIEITARERGLPHRHCDPDRAERTRLGIRQDNDIRISAFFEGLAESAIQQRINESMRARERYWLERLLELNHWPVLFVCGANHSLHFLELLGTNNVEAALVAQDWST
jgi:hypothetical protein